MCCGVTVLNCTQKSNHWTIIIILYNEKIVTMSTVMPLLWFEANDLLIDQVYIQQKFR